MHWCPRIVASPPSGSGVLTDSHQSDDSPKAPPALSQTQRSLPPFANRKGASCTSGRLWSAGSTREPLALPLILSTSACRCHCCAPPSIVHDNTTDANATAKSAPFALVHRQRRVLASPARPRASSASSASQRTCRIQGYCGRTRVVGHLGWRCSTDAHGKVRHSR